MATSALSSFPAQARFLFIIDFAFSFEQTRMDETVELVAHVARSALATVLYKR